MIRLSVITDEVSQDLGTALDFADRFQLDGVELRSVWGRGPFEWTRDDETAIRSILRARSYPACCLSLPLFKCELGDADAIKSHMAHLRRSLEFADSLNCRLVRGFDFWRHGGGTPVLGIVEAYRPILPLLDQFDVTLVMETEPSVYAASGRMLRDVLEALNSRRVRALWDGGNLLFSDISAHPMEEYPHLRDWIAHVHVKDAVGRAGAARAVKPGTGESDVKAQLQRLGADGYDGWMSLETHYRLHRVMSEAELKLPSGQAFSDGGDAASAESMTALREMLFSPNAR